MYTYIESMANVGGTWGDPRNFPQQPCPLWSLQRKKPQAEPQGDSIKSCPMAIFSHVRLCSEWQMLLRAGGRADKPPGTAQLLDLNVFGRSSLVATNKSRDVFFALQPPNLPPNSPIKPAPCSPQFRKKCWKRDLGSNKQRPYGCFSIQARPQISSGTKRGVRIPF